MGAGYISTGVFGSNSTQGYYSFKNGATDIMYIDATNARVGIGTTSPQAKLDLSTTNGAEFFRMSLSSDVSFRNSFVNGWNGGDIAGDYLAIKVASGSGTQAEVMRLIGNGNVGIGTTAPGAKLDVVDSASNQFYLKDSNAYVNATSRTIKQAFLALNPSSAYTEAASIQAILTPYVGVTYLRGELALHTRSATAGGSGSDVTAMYINGDGNAGIGTTGPAYQLDVGGFNSSLLRAPSDLGSARIIGVAAGGAGLGNGAALNLGIYGDRGGVYLRSYQNASGSETADFYISQNNSTANAVNRFTILGASGNAGIGTTGPGAKLDVVTSIGATSAHFTDGNYSQLYIKHLTPNLLVLDVGTNNAFTFNSGMESMRITSAATPASGRRTPLPHSKLLGLSALQREGEMYPLIPPAISSFNYNS